MRTLTRHFTHGTRFIVAVALIYGVVPGLVLAEPAQSAAHAFGAVRPTDAQVRWSRLVERARRLTNRLLVYTDPQTGRQHIEVSPGDAWRRFTPSSPGKPARWMCQRDVAVPRGAMTVEIEVLAREITYGHDGPAQPVRLEYDFPVGAGFETFLPASGQPDLSEGDAGSATLDAGDVVFKGRAAYPTFANPLFVHESFSDGMNVITLTPESPQLTLAALLDARGVHDPFGMQATIESKLPPEIFDGTEITLPAGSILMFFELGTRNADLPSFDFQDLMVLVRPAGGCVDEPSGFGGGSGTAVDPFIVCSVEHLDHVRNHLSSYFRQTADIDLSAGPVNRILPVGSDADRFTGTYDGMGHGIFGLQIDSSTSGTVDNHALFAAVGSGGVVQHLIVENAFVDGNFTAGIVVATNAGTLSGVVASGQVVTGNVVGGIAGRNEGNISDCAMNGTVGGLFRTFVGGVVGENAGTVARCAAFGQVIGQSGVGGLVGTNSGTVSQSYSLADVQGINGSGHGGLIGSQTESGAVVEDSYAQGSVMGTAVVGGLSGALTSGECRNTYSTGLVQGTLQLGGLIGLGGGAVSASFWDTQTSGQPASAAGTPKTTAEMQMQATFDPPWDFASVWIIDDGNDYPRLHWEP